MNKLKNTTMTFMVLLTISSCNGQENKSMKSKGILNECWTEVGYSENRMEWFENGDYIFAEPPMKFTEWSYGAYPPSKGKGTYVYQPETNEIFVDLTDAVDSLHNGQPIPKFISKKYFSIIEEKGDTVIVHTIPLGYEYDWEIDSTGKHKLIFLCEIDHLPFITQTYRRSENKKSNEASLITDALSSKNQLVIDTVIKYGPKISPTYRKAVCTELVIKIIEKFYQLDKADKSRIRIITNENIHDLLAKDSPVPKGVYHALTKKGIGSPVDSIRQVQPGDFVQFWTDTWGHCGIVKSIDPEANTMDLYSSFPSTDGYGAQRFNIPAYCYFVRLN